jgi:integrase
MYFATYGAMSLVAFCRSVYVPSRLGITPRAVAEIERVARQYDEFCGSPVADLCDEVVVAFLQSRVAAGDSPATVNGKRSKILALWRCAWRKDVVRDLPRDVPRMRECYDPPRARSTDELRALISRCAGLAGQISGISRSNFWASLFLVTASTGERPGALVRTRTEDVDLQAGRIRVRHGTVKTGRGKVYPLASWAVSAVAEIFNTSRELVWPWPHCRRHLWTSARKIMESAGIHPSRVTKDIFYSIRRWNLSYLAVDSLELAQSQAGHSSPAITLRHYIDPTIAENRRAVDVLPALPIPSHERQLMLF